MSRPQRVDMPIVARLPGPGPIVGVRSGDAGAGGRPSPSVDLLPSGGLSAAGTAHVPGRALALDALGIRRRLRDHPRDAGSWGEPAFAREVDLIRRHLAPIATRRSLSSSYSRESFRAATASAAAATGVRPAHIAYAVRWLELGDGRPRPPWSDLVTGRG